MSRQNPRHLERGWKAFESKVIHPGAPDYQRREMRTGFYAGALVVFTTLTAEVSDGDEVSESDLHLMADIDAELRAFQVELNRRAERTKAGQS